MSYVPVAQLQTLFDKIDKIEDHILSQDERKSLLNSRWVPFRKVCEELDVDPKTGRKYIRSLGWNTTKIGSKIYVDIEAVRASLDSNAKK